CVRRGNFLRNTFFITEVDQNAISEFSTIVSSELFDFDVILIFYSFDERHNGFSWLYDAFPFHMMNMMSKSFMPKQLRFLVALAKKQDSCAEDVMSRAYTSLTLGAIITISLLDNYGVIGEVIHQGRYDVSVPALH
ncbi:hypothetical protein Tco_1513691, partial [Tanacetum coccineum]